MATLMAGCSSMATLRRGLRSQAITGVRCSATMAGETHYKTLRLRPGATEKEVKKAFRNLALKYHPDVCKGKECTVQFQQINQAYQMILEEVRRAEQQIIIKEEEYINDDRYAEEWMGCEGAFVFSGGRPESVYCY